MLNLLLQPRLLFLPRRKAFFHSARHFRTASVCGNDSIVVVGSTGSGCFSARRHCRAAFQHQSMPVLFGLAGFGSFEKSDEQPLPFDCFSLSGSWPGWFRSFAIRAVADSFCWTKASHCRASSSNSVCSVTSNGQCTSERLGAKRIRSAVSSKWSQSEKWLGGGQVIPACSFSCHQAFRKCCAA